MYFFVDHHFLRLFVEDIYITRWKLKSINCVCCSLQLSATNFRRWLWCIQHKENCLLDFNHFRSILADYYLIIIIFRRTPTSSNEIFIIIFRNYLSFSSTSKVFNIIMFLQSFRSRMYRFLKWQQQNKKRKQNTSEQKVLNVCMYIFVKAFDAFRRWIHEMRHAQTRVAPGMLNSFIHRNRYAIAVRWRAGSLNCILRAKTSK